MIFPAPRRLRRQPGPGPLAGGVVRASLDPSLRPEGYVLDTTGDEAVIRHADANGLRYAESTLAQLEQRDGRVEAVVVEDWPDLPVRGFMLDISRDRVPTTETLDRLFSLLAAARFNHLELYMEHTFAYAGHEDVWRDASPFTAEEVRALDARCRAAGIELTANQNCFGHMNRWLRHPRYASMAARPGPAAEVLAPTEENARFALSLFEELLPNFSSRRVHIDCDEPFELGRGATAAYAEHVARIAGPLAANGYEVLVWGDVFRRAPDLIRLLPEGTVAVPWHYEAPYPEGGRPPIPDSLAAGITALGFDVEAVYRFDADVAPLADAGAPFWVAPGTSSWNTFVGRVDNALGNIADAVDVARRRDADGLLLADWGDNGHPQPPSVSWPPLLYAGALAWAEDANRGIDLAAALDAVAFDDQAGGLGAALIDLGQQWRRTGLGGLNASPLFTAVYGPSPYVFGTVDAVAAADVVSRIDAAVTAIASARPAAPDGALVQRELSQAAALARVGALRLSDGPAPTTAEVEALLEEQRQCWLARSRPGGLADSLGRLAAGLKALRAPVGPRPGASVN